MVNQPAHQELSFRTVRVQASDVWLLEAPDCDEPNIVVKVAEFDPSVGICDQGREMNSTHQGPGRNHQETTTDTTLAGLPKTFRTSSSC